MIPYYHRLSVSAGLREHRRFVKLLWLQICMTWLMSTIDNRSGRWFGRPTPLELNTILCQILTSTKLCGHCSCSVSSSSYFVTLRQSHTSISNLITVRGPTLIQVGNKLTSTVRKDKKWCNVQPSLHMQQSQQVHVQFRYKIYHPSFQNYAPQISIDINFVIKTNW